MENWKAGPMTSIPALIPVISMSLFPLWFSHNDKWKGDITVFDMFYDTWQYFFQLDTYWLLIPLWSGYVFIWASTIKVLGLARGRRFHCCNNKGNKGNKVAWMEERMEKTSQRLILFSTLHLKGITSRGIFTIFSCCWYVLFVNIIFSQLNLSNIWLQLNMKRYTKTGLFI